MPRKKKTASQLSYYKPTQARALKTFQQILKVALEIIEVENLVGLNTNRVAEECGINIGTLYHYFPNKDAIILALYQAWYDEAIERSNAQRAKLSEKTNVRVHFKHLILDTIAIDGYSCQSAVELERAMKLRPELADKEDAMTDSLICLYEETLVTLVPKVSALNRGLMPPMILAAVWDAITIAAEAETRYHEVIADHAALMIAALVRQAKSGTA